MKSKGGLFSKLASFTNYHVDTNLCIVAIVVCLAVTIHPRIEN